MEWDSTNGRVNFFADRSDPGHELFTRPLSQTLTEDGPSWSFTGITEKETHGYYVAASSFFLGNLTNDKSSFIPDSLRFNWFNGNPTDSRRLNGRYWDSDGTMRLNEIQTGTSTGTTYRGKAEYDCVCRVLNIFLIDSNGNILQEDSYDIGTNPNDGFTFGKVGIGADGQGLSHETEVSGWTDDLEIAINQSITFSWDFDASVDSDGDGSYTNDIDAIGPNPMHVYGDNGVFTATVTVTDEQGAFRFSDVGPARYLLEIDAAGYLPTKRSVEVTGEDSVYVGVIRLDAGESITGFVRSETGAPLARARVSWFPQASGFSSIGGIFKDVTNGRNRVVTDDLGSFFHKILFLE